MQHTGYVTHYAAGLVQVDIMLAMTRKVAIIGIAATVFGENVKEVVLSTPGYEPVKKKVGECSTWENVPDTAVLHDVGHGLGYHSSVIGGEGSVNGVRNYGIWPSVPGCYNLVGTVAPSTT